MQQRRHWGSAFSVVTQLFTAGRAVRWDKVSQGWGLFLNQMIHPIRGHRVRIAAGTTRESPHSHSVSTATVPWQRGIAFAG